MANGLLLLLLAALANLLFFRFIPRCGSVLVELFLYSLRDKLFEIGVREPGLRTTRLFRDVDFVAATCLHVVRDHPPGEAQAFVRRLEAHKSDSTDARGYLEEVKGMTNGELSTVEDIIQIAELAPVLLKFQAVLSRPAAVLLLPIFPVWLTAGILAHVAKPRGKTEEREENVERLIVAARVHYKTHSSSSSVLGLAA